MQRMVQRKNGLTDEDKNKILQMRKRNIGYRAISEELGLNHNTVKSYCQRHNLGGPRAIHGEASRHECKYCGKKIRQNPGRKEKKFCSDKCRFSWWNSHLDQVNRKTIYEHECEYCHKPFISYGNQARRYCSQLCYMTARFGYRDYWEGKARIYLNANNKTD